LMSSCRKNAW